MTISHCFIKNVAISYWADDDCNVEELINKSMYTHSWISVFNEITSDSKLIICEVCHLSLTNIFVYPYEKVSMTCEDVQLKKIIE